MKKVLCYMLFLGLIACGGEAAKQEAPKTATVKTNTNNKPTIRTNTNAKKTTQPQKAALEPVKNYKAKNEGWLVNFEEAYAQSQKTGKPIMANFTGSDWCGWCKRLDKSVFHQPGFDKWAKENVVLLELDFPRRFRLPDDVAAQNRSLQRAFGVRGYPSIWVFDAKKDASGKYSYTKHGKTGYTKTIDEFQKTVEGFISKRG